MPGVHAGVVTGVISRNMCQLHNKCSVTCKLELSGLL